MESLESRLDRLSPEQRKEVEDFVEFLLSRPEPGSPSGVRENPPAANIAPPLLIPAEPVNTAGLRPAAIPGAGNPEPPAIPSGCDEPGAVPFHEIDGGDRLTGDYMDYGQFESRPSPATGAVKKVRRKIVEREEKDKPHHLLDWVD